MRNGTYYLNNNGSRWVTFDNGQKTKVNVLINGKTKKRTILYIESFGNFAYIHVKIKSKIAFLVGYDDNTKTYTEYRYYVRKVIN